ncbi:MAG: EAL domain-containing response regulator [Kordiimonadaceae bacterium]|nr:EAL domain-containing response regulator [Kordiimonadaceae bacterium]
MQERILVVDDSITSCQILNHLLRGAGYEVVCAYNGVEALAELSSGSFSMVITDIDMPIMGGFELIRKIAELPNKKPIVMVMSAKGPEMIDTAQGLARAYELDFIGSLQKPINRHDLMLMLGHTVAPHLVDKPLPPELTNDVHEALSMMENALTPVFQPTVNCEDGSVHGVECLSRWKTSFGGLVGPDVFRPIALQHGFTPFVTKKILGLALEEWAACREKGVELHFNVNVAPRDVCSLSFVDIVREALEFYEMPPGFLTLELTEADMIDHPAIALEVLGRIRLMGVKLALDDFGAGIDPLLRLKSMPFTEMKTDRPFLQDAAGCNKSSVILDNTIDLAQRLGMEVTCEGVENEEQWHVAKRLGANRAQGYYIARPMGVNELAGWAKNWEPPEAMLQSRPSA